MATDYMRSMLNELMGSSRDDQENETDTPRSHFDHRDVCRPFLLKCCPHEVLTSTVTPRKIIPSDRLLAKKSLVLFVENAHQTFFEQ